MEESNEKLLWSIEEVADQFGVCAKTISRLIDNGELPNVRFGRIIRIRIQAVHHFLEQREQYNGECVESAVRNPTGERSCRIETPKDVKMAVPTKVRTTRSASPQMEKDFNALLGLNP